MFENYPTYLVADTNCFVDHLDGLKAIVSCQAFTIVVPLIGKNAICFRHIISQLLQIKSLFCLHDSRLLMLRIKVKVLFKSADAI